MAMPLVQRRLDRCDLLAAALLLALIPAVFGPLLDHLVRGTSTTAPYTDYPAHNAFAARMHQECRVVLPHPLYHFALLGVKAIIDPFTTHLPEPNAQAAIESAGKEMQGEALAALNQQYAPAAVVTVLLFLVLLAFILWFQIRQAAGIHTLWGVWLTMPLIVGLMLAAPIALLHGIDGKFYFGYVGINVWHSPTVLAARPFALLTFLCVLAAFRPQGSIRRPGLFLIAVIVIIGALAKPSFLIALLPATMLAASYRMFMSKEPVDRRLLITAILVPAGMVLAWQSKIYAALTGGAHAKFSPLDTMRSMSDHLAIKFALSVLFPVVCYIAWGDDARRRFRLNFAWLAFGIGLGFTYLLAETKRTAHGNFLWSAQLALFVLLVESTLCVIESVRIRWPQADCRRRTTILAAVCAGVLAMHVGFGIWYYAHLVSTPNTVPLIYK